MNSEFHLTECYCSFRMDKCFSSLQLIFPFIITGNLLTFSVSFSVAYYFHQFGSHLTEWYHLINFGYHCKKVNKSTSALKSDNDSPGFKHSGQFPSMQSFELELHVCVSTRSWAVGHNTSLNFKLEFIPFAKSEAFSQT